MPDAICVLRASPPHGFDCQGLEDCYSALPLGTTQAYVLTDFVRAYVLTNFVQAFVMVHAHEWHPEAGHHSNEAIVQGTYCRPSDTSTNRAEDDEPM